MRATVCSNAEFSVQDLPEPVPGSGQVRIEVVRCGICGSDLHARHSCDEWADMTARLGYQRFARSSEAIVFGHEFSGRVLEHGPQCRRELTAGTPVVALPILRSGHEIDGIGLSAHAPGAFAEQLLVQESLMMAVPNGLSPEVAALTEPMAVAWHAVRRGEVKRRTPAVVIGCGPIGLAVILILKAKSVHTVVASDYSPGRRALAQACGADVVVDPAEGSPYEGAGERGCLTDLPTALETLLDTREKLQRLPVAWWHTWKLAERLGAGPKKPVIFECVGVPGVLESIIQGAPLFSRVVVVGVCAGEDRLTPFTAINKEMELRFVLMYSPVEFRETLHMIAEGDVDPRPVITGTVGLEEVDAAFTALGDPDRHAKILVDPQRRG